MVWEGADGGLVRRRVVGISLGTWELSQLGVGRGPSGLRRQNPPLARSKVPLKIATEEEEPWPFWLKVCSFCSHPAHPGCRGIGMSFGWKPLGKSLGVASQAVKMTMLISNVVLWLVFQ